MSSDFHLTRRFVAWGFGVAALIPILLCFQPRTEHVDLCPVWGRVTYSGQPMGNLFICLDSGGSHSALGSLQDDGSFQLVNFQYNKPGAFQGRYHAHLTAYNEGTTVPAKYRDPRTSGLEIDVAADWNYLNIELH